MQDCRKKFFRLPASVLAFNGGCKYDSGLYRLYWGNIWGNIGVILRLYWVMLGLYWGYMG